MPFFNEQVAMTATLAVKNDSNTQKARALWVGTAGTLNYTDWNGNDVSSFPAQVGLIPIAVSKIKTGGTADNIWLLS